jgi:uncharacterized membrane protein YqaE (UPF0057 family)
MENTDMVACADQPSRDIFRDVVRVLASVVFPPLGVWLRLRFHCQFWLNLLLTLFGYIPGLIHAIWVLAKDRETWNDPC